MNKKSKIWIVVVIVITFALLLSNCGVKSTELTQVPTPAPTREIGTFGSAESLVINSSDGSDLNGYWWEDKWVPGLPTFETYLLVSPSLVQGNLTFYGEGIMEATAQSRGFYDYKRYVGTVSLMFAGDIGAEVWIGRRTEPDEHYTWEGPFLNVDCARRVDLFGIIVYNQEVVEVDFETALRWGMVVRGWYNSQYEKGCDCTPLHYSFNNVLVSKVDPALLTGDEQPVNLMNWLFDRIHYQQPRDFRLMQYLGGSTWQLVDHAFVDPRPTQLITTDPQHPNEP